MAYNYHNWGLAGAAQRKYGNEFYDHMLMFHEMGILFKMLFPNKPLQSATWSSLCYIVGPY